MGKKRRRRSSLGSDAEEEGESGVKRLRGEALTVLLSSNITTTDGMRDAEGRKKEASKVKQTNKAKQHSTPKAVTFPQKNELPRVGF